MSDRPTSPPPADEWAETFGPRPRRDAWLAGLATTTVLAVLAVGLYLLLRVTAEREIRRSTAVVADQLAEQLSQAARVHLVAMAQYNSFWASQDTVADSAYRVYARTMLSELPSFRVIGFADSSGIIRLIEPQDGNQAALGFSMVSEPQRRKAMERARRTGRSATTPVLRLVQGGLGFLIYQPLVKHDQFLGWTYCSFRTSKFIDTLLTAPGNRDLLQNYNFRVEQDTSLIARSQASPVGLGVPDDLVAQRTVLVGDAPWKLIASPKRRLIGGRQRTLPLVVLGSGLLFALGFGLFVARTVRDRARTAVLNHELSRSNSEFGRLNSQLARNNADLAQANRQLRELDETKNHFVASVSHELRTPLTTIKSFAKILLTNFETNKLSPEKQRSFLQIINDDCDRLTRLLNQVLDVAKMESGQMSWNDQPVDLDTLLGRVVKENRLVAEGQGKKLDYQPWSGGLPTVVLDEDRLTQVLINLLSNALKFSGDGGRIELRASVKTPGQINALLPSSQPAYAPMARMLVLLSISDDGIGIPPSQIDQIFEKFHQVPQSGDLATRGTGLGLSISHGIITHYDGRLWAESAPGEGSTFHIVLPTPADA